MKLFDTHAHYNDEKFDIDREDVINKVHSSGVERLVNAGYSLESSKKAFNIAKNYDWMYVICGISPNDIPDNEEELNKQIAELEYFINKNNYDVVENVENAEQETNKNANKTRKIVAIGEIGLDYYWNKENKELQKYAFEEQIKLANRLNMPIVIHCRDAIDDTLAILKGEITPVKKGIFHCCPLNRELVKQALKLDFYISFAGPVTFKNSKNAAEIISMVPSDRTLIETDSPYLSPEPNRGKRNNSSNVRYIAQKIADVREESLEQIAMQTYQNAKRIFEIYVNS